MTTIPASRLYHQLPKNVKLIRFAFCQKEDTLLEAEKRLMRDWHHFANADERYKAFILCRVSL